MRSRSMLALAAVIGFAGPAIAQQAVTPDSRPGVAVFAFENGGSMGMKDPADLEGLQRGFAGELITELTVNNGWRVVERQEIQKLTDEQNLGASGRVDPQTAAKVGKIVGAKYAVTGTFIANMGTWRVDIRLINVETTEIMKTESATASQDKLFSIITDVAQRLMKDANLPPLPKDVATQRMSRQVPTEAMTLYSRALLYQDQGKKDKAVEMYKQAIAAFPNYTEAQEGLKKIQQG
ncbi:MAG TPA: CsgG/HfaB family protein [Gemmatimonadales bacterium]|jgi:TolB-like protein|nr:CsgG/HfaB family protein [Gemmatimonadales bacterium]